VTTHCVSGGSALGRAATDAVTAAAPRQPAWSGRLTHPLAERIPAGPGALRAIRVIHSAAFAAIAASVVVVAWDGARARPRRRTAAAGGIAIGETVLYLSNNQVCPLTPLAEELGAASGTVTDLYLPRWLSNRIPLIASSALVAGLFMNGETLARRRRSAGNDDDLARRPTNDLRRDAAEDQALEIGTRSRSQDDQVRVLRSGGLDDRLGGIALPHQECGRDAGLSGLPDDDLGTRREPVAFLVHTQGVAARKAETVRLDDTDDKELGPLGGSPTDRLRGGMAG
jgi:hypothetical protein